MTAAIERELARGGQAFFLHNRVETIDETAERVRAHRARGARAGGARPDGRGPSSRSTMLEFLRGDGDVLVCTTIVESGLDIPTANTLIVERADVFGLAQLYQIRGPRGPLARARLRLPALPERRGPVARTPASRLATLSDYTELGSGFKIAMRDLEIRGAGNLLGEEQSGHVAAVGFELYVGMLDEAVRLLAGDSADEAAEPVRLDLPVDAYVPGDYVPYEAAKIEIHRRVAGAREVAQLIVLREELEDRFGPVPEPLDNLIRLQDARIKLGRAGAKSVDFRQGRMAVDADRARLARRQGAARAGARGRSTSRAAARCACGCPTRPPSASGRSSRRPRRSSRWQPSPGSAHSVRYPSPPLGRRKASQRPRTRPPL